MKFLSLTTMDGAFRYHRLFSILFLIGCALITISISLSSLKTARQAQSQVYILHNGSLLTATAQAADQNRDVEARAHVKQFHELFFTLDPDEKAIEGNISKALYLADNSAKQEYENLQEQGFYNAVISANMSVRVQVDSVVLSTKQPWTARTYAHESLIRATTLTSRNLVTECALREVTRSENNPHGFIIEGWRVLENKNLKTTTR